MEQEGLASWVDATSINSTLSGLILILISFWAAYMLARLWQQSLAEDAAMVIAHAQKLGLHLKPGGMRSRVVMRGRWAETDAGITWKGGMLGERTVVTLGDRVRRVHMLTDPEDLDAVLQDLVKERERGTSTA